MNKREKLVDPYKPVHKASVPTIIPSSYGWKNSMDLKDPRKTEPLMVKPAVNFYLDTKD